MCNVLSRFRKTKEVTGYKIVVDCKGRFYSPFTGVLYHTGKVTPATGYGSHSPLSKKEVLNPNCRFFASQMKGKTGVLLKMEDAEYLQKMWGRKYVKNKFSTK